ncbi:MAG TPA: sigma-70 family RNA polymerase sigma factor [Gemmataceae bacterium]|nr:sigma-70 family RNA polymerase sigma factor [Gemmataceae bacterium]
MADGQLQAVIRHLRGIVGTHGVGGLTDAQLLERFVTARDEAAFEVLLWRHGPMVLNLCRRLLHRDPDIEDAFQATFLVLVRKARSISKRSSVASWLYKVAYRVALEARTSARRRALQERPLADLPAPKRRAAGVNRPAPDELAWRDLREVLDEEVSRLPERYRAPFVLCYLQGKTNEEAAQELGCPKGTISSRLAWARERLRACLARRGLTLSTGSLAGLLSSDAAASVPRLLVTATLRGMTETAAGTISVGAAALAKRAMRAMFLARLKVAAILFLTASALGMGAGLTAHQALMANQPAAEQENPPKPPSPLADRPSPSEERRPRTDWQGDPLPNGVLARMGSGRLRHYRASIEFFPDGKTMISVGNNGFRIWEVATGKLARQIANKVDWPWVSNRSAGAITVASIDDKTGTLTCQVVDLVTGQTRRRTEFKLPDPARLLTISPDGQQIAVFNWDPMRSSLLLYDGATGQEILRIPVPDGWVEAASFAPDGKTLALCDRGDTVSLHDTASGQVVRKLKREGDAVWGLAFAPDGRFLASMPFAEDHRKPGEVSVWDLATGEERYRLKTEPGRVDMVAFSPDGRLVATAGIEQQRVILWDLATGKEVRRLLTHSRVHNLAFSPDSKVLATAVGGAISLWDVATGQRLPISAEPGNVVLGIRFSRDGRRLIGFAGIFIAWEAATGREVRRFADVPHFGGWPPPLSPDESLIAAANEDGTIRLHDAATGKEVRTLQGHEKSIWTMRFSTDGRRLYSSSSDGTIRGWDVATGRELLRLTTNDEEVYGLVVSPDGRWLASCSQKRSPRGDYPITIWDLTTGREAQRLVPRLERPLPTMAFSPDSRLVAATTVESRGEGSFGLQVWEVATGKEFGGFAVNEKEGMGNVVFSPDGRMLATGGITSIVRLWELATGRQRAQFDGHAGSIAFFDGIAFSPDGRALAAANVDAPVYLWDVLGQLERRPPPTPAELEQAWSDLSSADAVAAFRAVRRLATAPDQALPFLRQRLKPMPAVDPQRVRRLLANLDNDDFAVRKQVTAELEKLGERAAAILQQALKEVPSAEARRRIEEVLRTLEDPTPEQLLATRAAEVLEYIGTPEARQLLEDLARGAPEARLTREAQASLERLAQRK